MKDLIKLSSAALTILAGITILVLWMVAGNDKGIKDQGLYQCRGCNYLYHDALSQDAYIKTKGYSVNLNSWMKNNRDPSPILMGFAVIIGIMWMATGVLGFFAKGELISRIYLLAGAITYILFVVLFTVIVERVRFIQKNYCKDLWDASCRKDDDWKVRHYNDSYEEFWGSSLFCFIIGGYQIAAAIFLCYVHGDGSVAVAGAQK